MTTSAQQAVRQRLLIVAPNWLGDLVMATVALEAITRTFPASSATAPELHLAVRRCWAPLFQDDPRIDQLVIWERRGRHARWPGIWRLARDWRRGGYDSIILMPPSLRVALAAQLAGIPRRFGFRCDGRGLFLSHALPLPRRGVLHYTAEQLQLVASWAGTGSGAEGFLATGVNPSLPGCENLEPLAGAAAGPPIWTLATSATYGAAKNWPGSLAAAFLERVVQAEQARIILLGDAAARTGLGELQEKTTVPWRTELAGGPGVVDLVGRTGLMEAVQALRAARICVAIDSGLMHLAAALGVPTVGLFGSSSPDWTEPRGRWTAVVAASGFSCHPCFRRHCNQDVFCMSTLEPTAIHETARQLLVVRDAEYGA
ncbi:MAG: lipopolysaccharide heptosyltransferase II [bacterium]